MDSNARSPLRHKTGDLATPPRDRLMPVRDLAGLTGRTESEIERLAGHMGLPFEALRWRGVFLPCLTLPDAFALHLALRTPVGESSESAELEELRQALRAERDRTQSEERRRLELEERLAAREQQMGQWADRLNDLELIVAERERIDRELEALRAQWQEAQVRQRDLVQRLQFSEEHRLLLEKAHAVRQADEAEAAAEAERAREAQATLQQQWIALRERGRRERLAERLRSLRRTLELANLVELNLENYCDRLERRLLQHGVPPPAPTGGDAVLEYDPLATPLNEGR